MSDEPNIPTPAMEDAEPKADMAPAPVLLIGLLALLVFWGMVYLNNHGGEFNQRVYAPYPDYATVDGEQFRDPVAAFKVRGKLLFMQNCSPCHQSSGLGSPGQFPPLVHSDWVNAATPNRVIRIVLCGLQGPLVLNGQPFTTGAQMTPFRDSKNDEEIAAILTFVRSNKDWQNDASPVTPEQVAKIREAVRSHPTTFTPDELLKVPLEEGKK